MDWVATFPWTGWQKSVEYAQGNAEAVSPLPPPGTGVISSHSAPGRVPLLPPSFFFLSARVSRPQKTGSYLSHPCLRQQPSSYEHGFPVPAFWTFAFGMGNKGSVTDPCKHRTLRLVGFLSWFEKATTTCEDSVAVVVLEVLTDFRSFKYFRRQIRSKNQKVMLPIIPLYRMNHPPLQDDSSPSPGEHGKQHPRFQDNQVMHCFIRHYRRGILSTSRQSSPFIG